MDERPGPMLPARTCPGRERRSIATSNVTFFCFKHRWTGVATFRRQQVNYEHHFCPCRGFCVDETKNERPRPCVQKNIELYRGALARVTFLVSEAKEACPILSDFVKVDDCEGGSLFLKKVQKGYFLIKNECLL